MPRADIILSNPISAHEQLKWQSARTRFDASATACLLTATLVLHCANPSRGCGVIASPALASRTIEASTIRKLQTWILPVVFTLFVINFVDRINIGFAALTMNRELAITSEQFGLVSGIFFWCYFVFEIPSNLLLHKLGARIWIARILVSWGIVAILTGFARTATHLYILRFLLGVAEAGYVPGMYLYLTYWFPKRQLAHAIAIFNAGNPAANIVGSPISGVILDHAHWFGVSSWRWLLILEGIPAILGGVLTYFLLPSRPAEATFLTAEEKNWIGAELAREEQHKTTTGQVSVRQALMHGRIWHLTAIYFMAAVASFSMIFWMPQFMKSLSNQYSNTILGLLVMIPYIVALPVMIFVSRNSDRTLERRYHVAIPEIVAAIALIGLAATPAHSAFSYVALWCLVASGMNSLYAPFWSLPSEFLTGFSAAAGIALINSFGNIGGFVGPYVMGAINKQTGSFRGGLVVAGISLFVSAMLILALRKRTGQQVLGAAATAQVTPARAASEN
jgi:ACS family tartrate transporter-like MFS transporter